MKKSLADMGFNKTSPDSTEEAPSKTFGAFKAVELSLIHI